MRADWKDLEPFRMQFPPYLSAWGDKFGVFVFRHGAKRVRVIACDGEETGWEHVSVSIAVGRDTRTPNWDEMCEVKRRFWDDEEAVIQLHPPKSEYVNNHANCLHLWKCVATPFPLPPSILVGIKEIGTICR